MTRNDPSYHLRCRIITNPDQIDRFREYFSRYRDHNAAARSEREAIGLTIGIGICPMDYFGQYDSN